MNNDSKKHDRAFSTLVEALDETNVDNELIAEHVKEIKRIEATKARHLRDTQILAANYFTKEKITELHGKSLKMLKCNDFDEEEYIRLFSDISTIELGHIDFLVQRQKEIDSIELKLNYGETPIQKNKTETIMCKLADILMKGGTKDD